MRKYGQTVHRSWFRTGSGVHTSKFSAGRLPRQIQAAPQLLGYLTGQASLLPVHIYDRREISKFPWGDRELTFECYLIISVTLSKNDHQIQKILLSLNEFVNFSPFCRNFEQFLLYSLLHHRFGRWCYTFSSVPVVGLPAFNAWRSNSRLSVSLDASNVEDGTFVFWLHLFLGLIFTGFHESSVSFSGGLGGWHVS